MAIKKCKECGGDVSTKAKTCPSCGARAPRKTSPFTWLVLIFIVYGIYLANKGPISHSTPESTNLKTVTQKPDKKPQPKPSWSSYSAKDKMTGEISSYANSPIAYPSTKMSFPYHDVEAWIGVGCNKNNEWAYIGFNKKPNLTDTKTKDGYNLINTRIKWDNDLIYGGLTQKWGDKFLHFVDDKTAINKISSANTGILELQWYGQQPTYFEFTLNGSSKALSEIRGVCSK